MLLAIAALALTKVTYTIPSTPVDYKMQVVFEGFVPVLGGMDGKFDVKMVMTVKGLDADKEGNPQALSSLKDFGIKMDGADLAMFKVDDVKKYFPPNTISMSPTGKVLKNDAPDIPMPVKLPGLDVKQVPAITYLPIEFPDDGIEVGKAFTYKKPFGDSDVNYTVTPKTITDDSIELDVKMTQEYHTLEDENKNVVTKDADAFSKVTTNVDGGGTIMFDRKKGLAKSIDVSATATSKVVNIKTKAESERKLKTLLKVSLADTLNPKIRNF